MLELNLFCVAAVDFLQFSLVEFIVASFCLIFVLKGQLSTRSFIELLCCIILVPQLVCCV